MPYRVATLTTPLWADHQRTAKNGKLLLGAEFKASEGITDGGLEMLHVMGEVLCEDGHKDGGWVELKNCFSVGVENQPTTTVPGSVIEFLGGKKKYLITIEEVE